MSKQLNNTKKGFTIIEVVLVLAIAGLIFLMVFTALPAMQRSQRDTARRDDLARFLTQITNYQTNNRGKLPGTGINNKSDLITAYQKFVDNYLKAGGDTFTDPDGEDYIVASVCAKYVDGDAGAGAECKDITDQTGGATFNHQLYIYQNAKCDGEAVAQGTGTRNLAIQYKLEGGGIYCGAV